LTAVREIKEQHALEVRALRRRLEMAQARMDQLEPGGTPL
jgi:hypothetical protein